MMDKADTCSRILGDTTKQYLLSDRVETLIVEAIQEQHTHLSLLSRIRSRIVWFFTADVISPMYVRVPYRILACVMLLTTVFLFAGVLHMGDYPQLWIAYGAVVGIAALYR